MIREVHRSNVKLRNVMHSEKKSLLILNQSCLKRYLVNYLNIGHQDKSPWYLNKNIQTSLGRGFTMRQSIDISMGFQEGN